MISTSDIPLIRTLLLNWFARNKRPLPWRNHDHWYPTFLSEFLLQQTQVEQALPYYAKFIRTFPDIRRLADAGEEDVLRLWTGLGYYARGRNMLKAARAIVHEHNGHFPDTMEQALRLPGIGPYTAAAILSIAFAKAYPVVDGNVIRVIARLFALTGDTRSNSVRDKIGALCGTLIDPERPGDFNEAVMELGAMVCTPRNPSCKTCPLLRFCRAKITDQTGSIPFRSSNPSKKQKKQLVYAILKEDSIMLVKRPDNGLLASMWELPSLDTARLSCSGEEISGLLRDRYNIEGKLLKRSGKMVHTYSHFRLLYTPAIVQYEKGAVLLDRHVAWCWQPFDCIGEVPVHRAHQKIFEWLKALEIKSE